MILKLRQRLAQEESGFTLVELLVVMLILGILAAIAIPAFFSQTDKAKDTDAKNNVKSVQTALESFATDNDGKYVFATAVGTFAAGDMPDAAYLKANYENTINDDAAVTIAPDPGSTADPDRSYEITDGTSSTGNTFTATRADNGDESYSCTDPGNAGCPEGGDRW